MTFGVKIAIATTGDSRASDALRDRLGPLQVTGRTFRSEKLRHIDFKPLRRPLSWDLIVGLVVGHTR
jgi:hypothetical protein